MYGSPKRTADMSTLTAAMIPDPYRRWVKGAEYLTLGDEYSKEGTCIGVGTREYMTNARACGVTYASPLPPLSINNSEYCEEFWRDYLAH